MDILRGTQALLRTQASTCTQGQCTAVYTGIVAHAGIVTDAHASGHMGIVVCTGVAVLTGV
eukprot:6168727-Pyramimonas_sp.AAC.1